MIYTVLLAAGSGSRMKSSSIPKQFLELKGIPIVKLAVDKFMACPKIDKIIVAAPAIWMSHTKDLLSDPKYSSIYICEGGRSRQESLYSAVKFIDDNFHSNEDDIVVSHDVARPFISLRLIEDNIEAMKKYDAADTVLPATDTIVISNDNETVYKIPNRKNMYQGQTPQTFKLRSYLEIYKELDQEYLENVTDAVRILAEHGLKVGLVKGDEFNIKITTEYDFRIASFLIGELSD